MARTLRRKKDKTKCYYEYKDEERNRPGAGDNYYHADMPSRRGRWRGGNRSLKHFSNGGRRLETREIKNKVLKADEVEDLYLQTDDKQSKENPWSWD